jgi:hypothetical protein
VIGDAFFESPKLVNLGYPLHDFEIARFIRLLRTTSKISETEGEDLRLKIKAIAKQWIPR